MKEENQKEAPLDRRDVSSSVVIRGLDATTFAQMEDFVNDLEGQPLERLLRDLPKLAKLSSTKFALVSYVVAGKFRAADQAQKESIREAIAGALSVPQIDPEAHSRIGKMLERLR
ncbi:MAG TPA: hypothetical protein VFL80_08475 [Thermoanaerobaculia bacterium]|nr:hypothetical protein [Thermoanaerobaculia bacterium]